LFTALSILSVPNFPVLFRVHRSVFPFFPREFCANVRFNPPPSVHEACHSSAPPPQKIQETYFPFIKSSPETSWPLFFPPRFGTRQGSFCFSGLTDLCYLDLKCKDFLPRLLPSSLYSDRRPPCWSSTPSPVEVDSKFPPPPFPST